MGELKACMGCFAEWDEEREICPFCGWHTAMEPEEDKEGWHTGQVLEKRYLLGRCYMKKKDFVIWRAYDSQMDMRCYFITSVGGSMEGLLRIAWGFQKQKDSDGCPVVLSLKTLDERYVLVVSMEEDVDAATFRSWIHTEKEPPEPLVSEITYGGNPDKLAQALAPDTLLEDRYRVVGCIGIGGFGMTYLCEDMMLQRNVAVKEYFPAEWAEREDDYVAVKSSQVLQAFRYGMKSFEKEAKLTAKFIHVKNLVTVFDVFHANDTVYLVMEYLDGMSVGREMKERQYKPFSPWEMAQIIVPVLHGLSKVHERNMIHSDISPGNILRTSSGRMVLIDFGAAKYKTENQPLLNAAFLKQNYAAPEQYRTAKEGIPKDEGPWTDLYAIGGTMYYLLTGHMPTDALSRLSAKSTDLVAPKKYKVKLQKGWMRLIHHMVEPDWKLRTASAEVVWEEIRELLGKEKDVSEEEIGGLYGRI